MVAGYSCLTLGELAITLDIAIAVTKSEEGLAMTREERDGARETKPPTQRPRDLNWAGPQGLAKGRAHLSPHRTRDRKKGQSSPKPSEASLTESAL